MVKALTLVELPEGATLDESLYDSPQTVIVTLAKPEDPTRVMVYKMNLVKAIMALYFYKEVGNQETNAAYLFKFRRMNALERVIYALTQY